MLKPVWFAGVLVLIASGLSIPRALSQERILSADLFYMGEGMGESLESARSAALQALMMQIQAFVSSSFVHVIQESGGQVKDSAASSVVVRSTLALKEVGERIVRREEGDFHVLKYVSKESVREMFRVRKVRVLELVRQASADIQADVAPDAGSSLKRYYWAYLLASIHPDTIRLPLEYADERSGFPKDATVLSAVPRIVERIVKQLSFRPMQRFVDGETTVWRCSVKYAGKPVGSLTYEYFDGVGTMSGEARDGETSLNLYLRGDTLRSRDISIRVEYRFEEEMDDLLRTADSLSSTRTLMQPLIVALPAHSPALVRPGVPEPSVKSAEINRVPKVIEAILNATGGFDGIMQLLQGLERQQRIVTGSASRFENLEGLYGVILSAEGLAAIVYQKGGRLVDPRSGAEVNMKSYKGMRLTWIQILEK